MNHPQLEVMIYQIVDDAMLKKNRSDGRDGNGAGPTGNATGWTPRPIALPTAACR